jgi:hypothetical protein
MHVDAGSVRIVPSVVETCIQDLRAANVHSIFVFLYFSSADCFEELRRCSGYHGSEIHWIKTLPRTSHVSSPINV